MKFGIKNRTAVELELTLRAVAIAMLLITGLEFLLADHLAVERAVVANIFFVMSMFARRHAPRMSVISLGLACLVPVGEFLAYQSDEVHLLALTAVTVMMIYLLLLAVGVFRGEADKILSRSGDGE